MSPGLPDAPFNAMKADSNGMVPSECHYWHCSFCDRRSALDFTNEAARDADHEAHLEACEAYAKAMMPSAAPFQRAQLAAIFLSKWVDGAEQPTPGRVEKRVTNAFALADLVWAKAHEVKP